MRGEHLDRKTYNVDEAAQLLGVSRDAVYSEFSRKQTIAGIPAIKVGNRIVVSARKLNVLLGINPRTKKRPRPMQQATARTEKGI